MKNLKIAAALLVSAAMFAGCDLLENVGSAPEVSLTALSEFDAQGEAVVQVVLSTYALEEVSVVLAASGDAAAAVTMEKAVKIAVGSKTQNVTVKLDQDKVTADSVLKISITSATGATVGSAKEVSFEVKALEKPEDPGTVSIESDDEFTEGAANITIKLNKALKEDVTVELEVKTSSEFASIPAAALAFDNPVTIKAGQTSAVVSVAVNPDDLPNGDNYAIIAIKNVTGNAAAAETAEVQILYTKAMVPVLREDWIIEYAGNYEYATSDTTSVLYDLIMFEGLNGQTFYFDYYSAGTLEYNEMTPSDYVLYKAEKIAEQIAAGKTAKDLGVITPTNEPYGLLYYLFDPDEYEAILIACDADGNVTGDYAYTTFEVVDPEVATDEYNAWIGAWNIGENTFYVLKKWNNKSFTVYGFDTDYSMEVPAYYDVDGDFLYFEGDYVDESSKYEFYFLGITEDSYLAWGDPNQNYRVATISNTDGVYNFEGVPYVVTYNDGTTADRIAASVGILGYGLEDESWYMFRDCIYVDLPCTISKVNQTAAPRKAKANELRSLNRVVKSLPSVNKGMEAKAVMVR